MIWILFTGLCFGTAAVQAQIKLVRMPEVEKGDTLLCGIFREADAAQFNVLWKEYDALMEKQLSTQTKQKGKELQQGEYSDESQRKQLAEIEAKRAKAMKSLTQVPDSPDKQKMVKEMNDAFDKMIADLPKEYERANRQIAGQDSKLTAYDPSEYSNEKKYAVKRKLAAMAVGGRLYNYAASRDFRHGRAPVAIEVRVQSKIDGRWITNKRWGFIDETGRRVVPCRYNQVFDFNNRKYYKGGVFDNPEDQDDRSWTTAWDTNDCMGMIDADGQTVIPFKFRMRGYNCIAFFKTEWGELAPVCDFKTNKYGIIDRSGNYTMQPTSSEKIVWYTDVKCFGTTGDERIFFDAVGKSIDIKQRKDK